jgi:broad specificity phosphatase PhoE
MTIETSKLVIVRHGDVRARWKGICYGQRDVELCDQWMQNAGALINQLAALSPSKIYHSGLLRTRWLAEQVDERLRRVRNTMDLIPPLEDLRLRERNYGSWEGMSWDDAYASDPDNFHDLIHKPNSYRPPHGETTSEMQARIVEWYESIPQTSELVLAIAHSGPIASLAGHLKGLPATDWQDWMLRTGEAIVIERPLDARLPISIRRGLS